MIYHETSCGYNIGGSNLQIVRPYCDVEVGSRLHEKKRNPGLADVVVVKPQSDIRVDGRN